MRLFDRKDFTISQHLVTTPVFKIKIVWLVVVATLYKVVECRQSICAQTQLIDF